MNFKSEPLSYYLTKASEIDLSDYRSATDKYIKNANYDYGQKFVHTDAPIIPFKTFLIDTPFDFVMALNTREWAMFELLKVPLGKKLINIVLISKRDGKQYVGGQKKGNNKSIREIASYLGYEYYDAQLVIKDENQVSFNSPDGALRKINIKIPTKWNPLNSEKKYMYPRKRNSHSMNHNQENMTYIVDVYKALPFYRILSLKDLNANFSFKKVFGIPIRLPIAQSVISFARGEEEIHKWCKSLNLIWESKEECIFEKCYKTKDGKLISRIEYYFEKHDEKLHLKKILSYSPRLKEAISKIEFTPPLIDLRYKLNTKFITVIGIFIDGKEGIRNSARPYLIGSVEVESNKLSTNICITPGVSYIKRNHTLDWWKDRDVITRVSKNSINFKAGIN
jgi:hypothetical protein